MRYVVIIAGGAGTRLWPLSRQGTPKQLLRLFEGRSLLQLAYERVAGLVPAEQILVCASRSYADVVLEQLPELPQENLLGEPVGRDSLNAIAWAGAVILDRDPQASFAVVTADHLMDPVAEFSRTLTAAFEAVEDNPKALATLGVVPHCAHTGYGYLKLGKEQSSGSGVFPVLEFKEKPTAELAGEYLATGDYLWNSGMFVWQADTFWKLLTKLKPHNADLISRIVSNSGKLNELFQQLVPISVDYALMEPAAAGTAGVSVICLRLQLSWRDLGGYMSLAAELVSDVDMNRVVGSVVTLDSAGCLVYNTVPDHVVACLGVKESLVVNTPGATLVAALKDSERVKELVALVRSSVGECHA